MTNQKIIQYKLNRLSHSRFRSQFHLQEKDKLYIQKKGLDVMRNHALDFVEKRLSPAIITNDGKQTPWKGHPVFVAQHATGTCCRKCLNRWHDIEMNVDLTMEEKLYIVDMIMTWIEKELKNQ